MNVTNRARVTRAAVAVAASTLSFAGMTAHAANSITTTFTGGDTHGWVGTGGQGGATFVDTADGNPAPSLRTAFPDFSIFGITYANDTHPSFLGNYTQAPFTISIDVKVRMLELINPGVRDLVLELRDYTNPPAGYPYVSVYYDLADLRPPNGGGSGNWENYSVAVGNPSQAALPPGWGGTGDEDPVTFEPRLPPGRTFANVLAGIDEIVFTTLKPGFFYTPNYFDVSVDNISLSFIPEPGSLTLVGAAGVLVLRRRRTS